MFKRVEDYIENHIVSIAYVGVPVVVCLTLILNYVAS